MLIIPIISINIILTLVPNLNPKPKSKSDEDCFNKIPPVLKAVIGSFDWFIY